MVRPNFTPVITSLIFETLRVIAMVTVVATVAVMEAGMVGDTAAMVEGIGADTTTEWVI